MQMQMIFHHNAFCSIINTVGTLPPETGGILLGDRKDYIVEEFIYDSKGNRSSASYDPDIEFLNRVVKQKWEEERLELLGFVHSHPRGVNMLSGNYGDGYGDLGYLRKIFDAMPTLKKFLVPIVHSNFDNGGIQMFPYIIERDQYPNYELSQLLIIPSMECYAARNNNINECKVKKTKFYKYK